MRARRLLLTTVVYLVVAGLVLGTARTVATLLALPRQLLTILAGVAVVGWPLALALAWVYEPPGRGE